MPACVDSSSGPVSDAALPSHPDAASALEELDGLLAANNEDDLVQYAIATHSVYLCSEETLLRASELERRNGRLHIHVSETRKEVTATPRPVSIPWNTSTASVFNPGPFAPTPPG